VQALEAYSGAGSVAVVGHRPGLHELAAYLLTGKGDGIEIAIKKGGVVRIRFDGSVEPGVGELRWLLTPKVLRTVTVS
jgi:phosphohistidine phosphatase